MVCLPNSNQKELHSDSPRTISCSPALHRLLLMVNNVPLNFFSSFFSYSFHQIRFLPLIFLSPLFVSKVWWWKTLTGRALWNRPFVSSTSWLSPQTSCAPGCSREALDSYLIRLLKAVKSTRMLAKSMMHLKTPVTKKNKVSRVVYHVAVYKMLQDLFLPFVSAPLITHGHMFSLLQWTVCVWPSCWRSVDALLFGRCLILSAVWALSCGGGEERQKRGRRRRKAQAVKLR